MVKVVKIQMRAPWINKQRQQREVLSYVPWSLNTDLTGLSLGNCLEFPKPLYSMGLRFDKLGRNVNQPP